MPGYTNSVCNFNMQVSPLNQNETNWINSLIANGKNILQIAYDKRYTPKDLEVAYKQWKAKDKSNEELNQGLNTFGALTGELLRQAFPKLQWMVITDEYGSELGLFAEEKQVTIFPINLVVKRFERNEESFFVDLYDNLNKDLSQVLSSSLPT